MPRTPSPDRHSLNEYATPNVARKRLGYRSRYTFMEHVRLGYIAGVEKRGCEKGKRGGRYYFRTQELAYVGPGAQPTGTGARGALASAGDKYVPTPNPFKSRPSL
jgi:hypothetical protein